MVERPVTAQHEVRCKAMLGQVEGFSLALNYTAEDRRRQE